VAVVLPEDEQPTRIEEIKRRASIDKTMDLNERFMPLLLNFCMK
jgi:hypothetical protein